MTTTATVTTQQIRDPWIVRPKPNPSATLRMFCFPYAGLGTSVFRTWPAAFPPHVELVLMQPPGREGRWGEKPFQNAADLAAAATQAVLPHLSMPFVFFGHSLGAMVAFEVSRRLRAAGRPLPRRLFASGHRGPQLPHLHPLLHGLPDKEFIDRICREYGGIPQAVLDNADLVELMLPCLRADFTVFETYRYVDEAPLPFPITAFGGTRDRRITEQEIGGWRQQTAAGFRQEMFDGDHFFLQKRRDQLLASIIRDLDTTAAPNG
jgi:medium-chain acyl-[acyl-carrier-protein] hydrolase